MRGTTSKSSKVGAHARTHAVARLAKAVAGEQGGISADVGWQDDDAATRLSPATLKRERITFKQTPYAVARRAEGADGMELKAYQREALDDLRDYLDLARAGDPAQAWDLAAKAAERRALERGRTRSLAPYKPLAGMEDTPYVCIRLPTGGGKTLLAAETVPPSRAFMGTELPLVLWFAPMKTIVSQTVEALTKAGHPLRERLHAAFAG